MSVLYASSSKISHEKRADFWAAERLLQPLTAKWFWLGLASEGLRVRLLLRAQLDLGQNQAVPGPCQVKFNHACSTPHLDVCTYPTLQGHNLLNQLPPCLSFFSRPAILFLASLKLPKISGQLFPREQSHAHARQPW